MSATTNALRVPGASLQYEVCGSGPLLLMIAGGGGGGDGFNGIADRLADSYTIVTYDRRGFGRSALDDPDQAVSVETHADDAHRLLAALTSEPALVFGSSAGALIGLALVTRSPEQVRTLVAHEPPAHRLLPESEPTTAAPLEIYRREGALAAMRYMVEHTGVRYDAGTTEPGVALARPNMETAAANAESFFKYTAEAVQQYRIDFAALQAASARIVIAGGAEGQAFVGYQSALVVAARLGTTVVEFPGHHAGYVNQPTAFAAKLREVLNA